MSDDDDVMFGLLMMMMMKCHYVRTEFIFTLKHSIKQTVERRRGTAEVKWQKFS